jgi:hypothetical protein
MICAAIWRRLNRLEFILFPVYAQSQAFERYE